MRKKLTYALLAAFCAILLAAPLEGGGVMLIGMRNAMLAGDGGWKNPYVTDGLVRHWDGIWNAGGGVHDSSIQGWVDLANDTLCQYSKTGETPNWQSNCWRSVSALDGKFFEASFPDIRNANTIEVLVSKFTNDRGVIIGSYGMPNANGVSFERFDYNGYSFRAYYNSNPQLFSTYGDFPLNQTKYYAAVQSASDYGIYNENGQQLRSSYSSGRNFKSSPCRIGTDSRDTTMCWNGDIFSIRIYSRALTAQEIAANYAVDKARFNLT